MFNNFVNFSDFTRFIWGIRHGYCLKIISLLTKGKVGRTKKQWSKTSKSTPATWRAIPEIEKRTNRLISGNENTDYYQYISKKYLSGQKDLVGLSLGCGSGHRELIWAGLNNFKKIEGIDISDSIIKHAQKRAEKNNLSNILEYRAADIKDVEMPENHYDVVFVEHSLHHFSPLESYIRKVSDTLKPSGYFIVNEFVGPARFQWTDRQLEIVNGVLATLPAKYRKHVVDGSIKRKVIKPSRLILQRDMIPFGTIFQWLTAISVSKTWF